RSVKRRFEETVFKSPSPSGEALSPSPSGEALSPSPVYGGGQGGGTYPDPVDHCRICRWIDVCELRRRQDDHLCLVAGMRRDQTRRLQLAGIRTMATLAASAPEPIQGINQAALDRLRRQAKLQVERKEAGDLTYEVLAPLGEHLGFQALPAPTPADIFFDMEGDPFVGEDGLEYLFGVTEMGEKMPQHHAFWAHDTQAEKRAFEQAVDCLIERLDRGKRTTEIVDAAASIVAYEEWLDSRDQGKLDEILAYNADDCLSTAQLRDWLEARRLQAIARYGDIPRPGPDKAEPGEVLRDIDQRTAAVLDKLLAGLPEEEDK